DPYAGDASTDEKNPEVSQDKVKDGESKLEEIDDLNIPEYALFRFIDPTIEPGYSYQYRIKVRMTNPNYGKHNLAFPALGRDKEIAAADWTQTRQVAVPRDSEWYVVDDRPDKDKLVVQIHHWVDIVQPDPDDVNQTTGVGDWSIWERALGYRGEYV